MYVLFSCSNSIFSFVVIVPIDNCEYETTVFPEKGVYFMQVFNADGSFLTRCTSFTIPNYNFVNNTVKKIDEKYLPESGGTSIKKIEFTDRPTAQNWFVENSGKVLKTVIETFELSAPFSFTNITMIDEYDIPSAEFTLFSLELDEGNITIRADSFRISTNGFIYQSGKLGDVPESNTLTDDSWGEIGLKVTIYYIAEGGGDSGDEGGDSPSCLVVVTNNSTDAIEVSTKKMIENNEVVDVVNVNAGYGETITFENTQKGSVATLKTTLPCIVRDGGNPDIVYSNSEYVEVDNTNQITYITIPEDSDTIEILVGE